MRIISLFLTILFLILLLSLCINGANKSKENLWRKICKFVRKLTRIKSRKFENPRAGSLMEKMIRKDYQKNWENDDEKPNLKVYIYKLFL